MDPEGLEPSPVRLRAGYAAANTSDPIHSLLSRPSVYSLFPIPYLLGSRGVEPRGPLYKNGCQTLDNASLVALKFARQMPAKRVENRRGSKTELPQAQAHEVGPERIELSWVPVKSRMHYNLPRTRVLVFATCVSIDVTLGSPQGPPCGPPDLCWLVRK